MNQPENKKQRLTKNDIRDLPITGKKYWITDADHRNMRLLVGATGSKTWFVRYRDQDGKSQQYKIGAANVITPSQARDLATEILARVLNGENVKKEKPIPKLTYGEFISGHYENWVVANRRTGQETIKMLYSTFDFLIQQPIEDISIHEIEQWRTKRINEGKKRATINRNMTALKASINWGVEQGIINENPITKLKPLSEDDSDKKIRYLSPEERKRLFAALDTREEEIRQGRDNHNALLAERKEKLFLDLRKCAFADYLKPMVIVSLNTGIRRGSLYQLLWSDIDFQTGNLTIRAAIAKGKEDIHIPMNPTMTRTLSAWKEQCGGDGDELVFLSPVTNGAFDNCKNAWANLLESADIQNFRWHDMRHDFASQLVMNGIDLNTVRELMGHKDLKMTLRYAHLAPKLKKKAVETLDADTERQ